MALTNHQTTRWRPYKSRGGTAYAYWQDSFGTPNSIKVPWTVKGSQYTESEGHPFLSSKKKGMSDLGGEFFTQKKWVEFGKSSDYKTPGTSGSPLAINRGNMPITATDPRSADFHPKPYSPDNELDALGATAISIVAPNNPVASLTQALYELRAEGLPHLPAITTNWRDKTNIARNAGSEYLNVQFGWGPLASDVSDFAGVVTDVHGTIKSYRDGIGKPIRRSYVFPTVREQSSVVINPFASPNVWGTTSSIYTGGATTGWLIKKTEVIRERKFSGCFTYYFPSEILGSKKLADYAVLAHQLGLEPSPETVWNVAPWSWAVDWFSNTGDVISNWTRFHQDGLLMRYGYMMEHSIATCTYTLVGATARGGVNLPVSDVKTVIETKIRRKANPYGFGVSWDGLSTFQASIAAAIGISRS